MARRDASPRKVVGARELKTRLGRYLRAVREGAIITVTDRGQPIAHLIPLEAEEAGIEATLDELGALGILTKGTGEPLPPVSPARERGDAGEPGEPIERTIARGRDERL